MKAKFIQEKFVEDSDPVEDLGIGIRHMFNSLKDGDVLLIVKDLKITDGWAAGVDILPKGGIILVHEVEHKDDIIDIAYTQFKNIENYKKKLPSVQLGGRTVDREKWTISFDFFKEHFRRIDPKKLEESLNEKFTEDSDPVEDLGIGSVKKLFQNLKEKDILVTIKPLQITNVSLNTKKIYPVGSLIIINDVYWYDDDELSIIYTQYDSIKDLKNDNPSKDESGALRKNRHWNMDYEFFEKYFRRFNKSKLEESLNEKFTEDSDPVEDLEIGIRKQISKFMKEIYEIDTDDNALAECAKYGHTEWVKYLLARGANVHFAADYALRWAKYNGHTETVKVLQDHIAKEYKVKKVNEKFTEDSDPVEDLGIGTKQMFNNLNKGDFLIIIKPLTMYYSSSGKRETFPSGSIIHINTIWREANDITIVFTQYKNKEDYKNNIVFVDIEGKERKDEVWSFSFDFFKEHFRRIDPKKLEESLNEKFTEDSDPVEDLDIGISKKIKDFLDDVADNVYNGMAAYDTYLRDDWDETDYGFYYDELLKVIPVAYTYMDKKGIEIDEIRFTISNPKPV